MPTIYIGLGGTGLRVLSRIKKRFASEGKRPGDEIQFIGVDIGGEDAGGREGLDNEEYVLFNRGNVQNIIEAAMDYNRVSEWWFDKEYRPNFPFNQHGAGQNRTFGRLALAYNGEMLVTRISRCIAKAEW
jgi:hypothetical protein